MTLAYLDSSVLVKRYVKERGTREIDRLFDEQRTLLTSSIAWSECLAALSRKRHDGSLSVRGHDRASTAMAAEWRSLNEIGVTREIRERVRELLSRAPLRGMDAIHLASALWAEARLGGEVVLYCSDKRLVRAARSLGLTVTDPERGPARSPRRAPKP
jgi:predicted nucleic acid-binding protein